MKTKIVEGKTITGEPRKYTFKLLEAVKGLELFHKYTPRIAQLIPNDTEEEEISITQLLQKIPDVLTWDSIGELARELLCNAKIEIDGEVYEAGESGIGDYALGDPLEVYAALFYAIGANYPKYIDPLFSTLGENQGEEDTNQNS